MTNLLTRIKQIRNNLATARSESEMVDELMELTAADASPELLRDLAGRLRAVADAKDGDWVTHTFTPSTSAELRCLADAYEEMANDARYWRDGRG